MRHLDSIYLRAEALRIPLNALLELTQRCNENCVHCYIKGVRDKFSLSKDDAELSFTQIKKLLNELAEEGTLNLAITGGEAMLREDFFNIAQYAKDKNFAVTIFSNGQLIDEAKADKLAEIMPVCVYVSIYGADADTHDKVTRLAGSFNKSLNAIQLLKNRGIKTGIKTILMKDSINQLKDIFFLGKSLDVQAHEFGEEITSKVDGSSQPKSAQIDDCTIYAYYKQSIPSAPDYIEELPNEEALNKEICGAGIFGVSISCYGDVYPCAELRMPLGNIKYQSFKDIWHKEEGFLKELRSAKAYKDLEDCRECSLVNFCRRCPGRALYESGDWRSCYENAFNRAQITKKINSELVHS